jgi:hypothetical protein
MLCVDFPHTTSEMVHQGGHCHAKRNPWDSKMTILALRKPSYKLI